MTIMAIIAIPMPIVVGLDQSIFVRKSVSIFFLSIIELAKPLRRANPRPLE